MLAVVIAAACNSKAPEPAQQETAWVPEVREGYAVTPDSVRLYYRMVGDGPETVIVGAANYFQRSLDGLATPTRRIVLYDIRGRGKTDSVPPSKMGIAEFDAQDIEVLRTLVGAERVALIGWSGGVLSAFRYAAEHPERVSALVLLTPVGPRWVPWWDDMRTNAAAKADTA
ncbi:MAG: alpha/beta fold hydrolase, partial [Gemmatimonadetes bacterium]|nr:alpha/beta fold hydrolase [Gemmatimonadota bacterium]